MNDPIDEHTEALREERGNSMREALIDAIVESGSENLDGAHGTVCFHFDDGMTMQVVFECNKKGVEIKHEGAS